MKAIEKYKKALMLACAELDNFGVCNNPADCEEYARFLEWNRQHNEVVRGLRDKEDFTLEELKKYNCTACWEKYFLDLVDKNEN